MTTCVFIQIRCKPGTTYTVAEDIALREIHSELYSTSGEYDLLMKLYIPQGEDVGKFINDKLRKQIEDVPSEPKLITSVRGVGYKFNGEVAGA